MAILAAESALTDSGLAVGDLDADRMGVVLGTGQATMHTNYDVFTNLAKGTRVPALSLLRGLPNNAANQISIRLGLKGECSTVSAACASSNLALGHALKAIRHGYLDAALVGGAEATLSEGAFRVWDAIRILAKVDHDRPEASCKPFSKDRSGIVLGEGAVMYVLEAETHARARGARIYAALAGCGTSADAAHIANPDPDGQAKAMRAALRDADVAAGDIGYINAHGTATPASDRAETRALRQAFGGHVEQIPISSTKALHGHLLGAAGAVELLATLFALNDGFITPTAHLTEPDPECDLDWVPNVARSAPQVHACLSNSFAFGGSNACVVLTR
jgi:3-oxoacyl-[acyl-carrier-protein] synthase II